MKLTLLPHLPAVQQRHQTGDHSNSEQLADCLVAAYFQRSIQQCHSVQSLKGQHQAAEVLAGNMLPVLGSSLGLVAPVECKMGVFTLFGLLGLQCS